MRTGGNWLGKDVLEGDVDDFDYLFQFGIILVYDTQQEEWHSQVNKQHDRQQWTEI